MSREVWMPRYWRALWVVGAAVLVTAVGMMVWLFWPWPQVTSIPGTVLTNEPADGTYQTGDVVRWTTKEVCQPAGVTDVEIVARLTFPQGTSDTPVVERQFTVTDKAFPECVTDNPTSMWIPGTLPSGTYEVLVKACVPNPTPRPRCEIFDGPTFTMERVALAEGATL